MGNRRFTSNFFWLAVLILALVFQANGQNFDTSDQLTGNYQIDVSRSTNIHSIVENVATQNRLLSPQKLDLQAKLTPTESVSILVNGSQVTLASPISGPTKLIADNKFQTINANSRSSVSIRTSLSGDTLKVSSIYDNTNFSITFRSINNGKNLQVTRTVKTDYLSQTVFAESFYYRTGSPMTIGGNIDFDNRFSNDTYIVPNGTLLTGALENYISTKDSQNNDKFRLIVQSPSEYQGAIIEGFVSDIERSNAISGTAKMTLNFQKIRLTNGQTYEFTGVIKNVSETAETPVRSNDEASIKGQNKTRESVKRGVLSAGVGAIIGAAMGGKKGALIGAGIGGVGGPATLFFEGNDDLILKQGILIDIQSTSPKK